MPLDDDYSGLIIFLAAILGLVTLVLVIMMIVLIKQ